MGKISGMLNNASGERKLLNPCYPVLTIDDNTELTVSPNMGTEDIPFLQMGIEKATDRHESGFLNLKVLWPTFEVVENTGFTDEEVEDYLAIIGRNAYPCIEAAEMGWRDDAYSV